MFTVMQDCMFPEKVQVVATYVTKLRELDFLQNSLLKGC